MLYLWSIHCNLFGQIDFRGHAIDTIVIKSHQSTYQFNEKGSTIGESDNLIIAYSKSTNGYELIDYYKDKYTRTSRPDTLNIRTIRFTKNTQQKVPDSTIQRISTALDHSGSQLEYFDQLRGPGFLEHVHVKSIKKIAKNHNIKWMLKKRYLSQRNKQEFITSCTSVDTFALYLSTRFDSTGYVVITDASRNFRVRVVTQFGDHHFEGKYPNPLKQPWYDHSDLSQTFPKRILNLNINFALEEILPIKFFLREDLTRKALYEDYITWFFEHRSWVY